MPNSELLRLTKEATEAFNAYKSALRQKGHKIRGDVNLAELTNLSGWEDQLRLAWIDLVKRCEREAGSPTQGELDLGEAPRSSPNPLGLHLNHAYRHTAQGVDYLFRGYNFDEDLYQFWNAEHGGMRGGRAWVEEAFDLIHAPEFDPAIPTEDPAITTAIEYSEEDGSRYVVKRVSPERFAELANVESSAGLRRKNPTAKAVEVLSDVYYVVTKAVCLDGSEDARLYLAPCVPASKEEKGTGFFKCGKARWRLDGEPIIVKVASLEDLAAAPDPGNAYQADPLEWVKRTVERGFVDVVDGEKAVTLAPRSYDALKAQIAPDLPDDGVLYVPAIDMNVRKSPDGLEIDGYEEVKAEPTGLALVEGGPEPPATEPVQLKETADGQMLDVGAKEPPSDGVGQDPGDLGLVEPPKGEDGMVGHAAAVAAVNRWDVLFSDTHQERAFHASIKFRAGESHDLFCVQWIDGDDGQFAPFAWMLDSDKVTGSHQSMLDVVRGLCERTLELRLSE